MKVSPELMAVLDLFTPDKVGSSTRATWTLAPEAPMILPDQLGQIPHIAVAAGKTGAMSLMNEDDLGGYSRTKHNVLGTYNVGPAGAGSLTSWMRAMGWRAWFQGAAQSESRSFRPLPRLRLTKVKSSTAIELGSENPGFFTLISSNGTTNPIFWALSHPANANPAPIFLYAFCMLSTRSRAGTQRHPSSKPSPASGRM